MALLFRALLFALACSSASLSLAETPATPLSEAAFTAGQTKLRASDLAGARTDFMEAVAQSPRHLRYLNALGLVYLRTNEGELAAKTYEFSCALTAEDYGANGARLSACYTLWANALLLKKDLPDAAVKFKSAFAASCSQEPTPVQDCLMVLYSLSRVLAAMGSLPEVAEFYEQLVAGIPATSPMRAQADKALQSVRRGELPQTVY
ncbi:tetratricopeptide (TPR) repeat protein [Variovorax paradoxus]|uniref:tetratricopeptide repeat protein n=1 Tax=Variovorax paradoxus TaxID=34073 RepID=UPI002781DF4D|nr:hypothetical protein [Variovorax paradoxus]MDQ0028157.1 tetratricopeptide (TPR) repeat protein [Variovorax paradoxus]